MMLLQGDVLAHVTTIINTDAYKLYSIYYILYVLCLYIIDLTVQFHCYTVIEMLLQFTVIIAKVAPSIATKTGLRESLLTYGFLDYVHGYMFFLTMGLIKHLFFFFFFFFFFFKEYTIPCKRSEFTIKRNNIIFFDLPHGFHCVGNNCIFYAFYAHRKYWKMIAMGILHRRLWYTPTAMMGPRMPSYPTAMVPS